MSRTTVRNLGIIALAALAVAFLPGGFGAASLLLGIISLLFLAAIGFLGQRLYVENRFTLLAMGDRLRGLMYGGLAVAAMTLIATNRLWQGGLGIMLWIILLGGSGWAVFHAWREARSY